MDRCFKKIAEGLVVFDSIWKKVYSTSEHSQREKLSLELKKELKKLQRCRDNIKSWIANNVIKDKSALVTQRRLIEKRMEQFKECEKEVKTKAYSKEGLAKAEVIDSEDEEKRGTVDWVQACIDKLTNQTDELEADLESEQADDGDEDLIESLETNIGQHKWHITQLETVLRLVHNESVDMEELNKLKEEIEDYVDNAQTNPEDYFDDSIYDELELPDVQISTGPTKEERRLQQEAEEERREAEKQKQREATIRKRQEQLAREKAARALAKKQRRAAQEKAEREKQEAELKAAQAKELEAKQKLEKQQQEEKQKQQLLRQQQLQKQQQQKQQQQQQQQQLQQQQKQLQQQKQSQQQPNVTGETARSPDVKNVLKGATGTASKQQTNDQREEQIGGVIRSFLGTGPSTMIDDMLDLPVPRSGSRNRVDMHATNASITSSLQFLPSARDSTLIEKYKPQNPAPHLASCFPSKPLKIFDKPAIFEKLETDTLFFIFYHQQGTYQQYLAARELKRHSWRFHKNYMTWFQRHEEPTVTTEDFERGTYVYFDHDTRWGQLLKENFTFEYRYLEDELACT